MMIGEIYYYVQLNNHGEIKNGYCEKALRKGKEKRIMKYYIQKRRSSKYSRECTAPSFLVPPSRAFFSFEFGRFSYFSRTRKFRNFTQKFASKLFLINDIFFCGYFQ